MSDAETPRTEPIQLHSHSRFPGVTIDLLEGKAADGKNKWTLAADKLALGSHAMNNVPLDDGTVSRFHCELSIEDGRVRVVDCGSRNGTWVEGVRVRDGYIRSADILTLGRTRVRVTIGGDDVVVPLSQKIRLHQMVGTSSAMRRVFHLLERYAQSDSTVLLQGETGTGKESSAEAVHEISPRRGSALIAVDCGSVNPALLESELFGHEEGAFAGAERRREGAFQRANGGTLFLDEIGELPLDLQPKLLRAMETKSVRRMGSDKVENVDVRLVVATHRDLKRAVNEGRFRADLFYRVAVLSVELPPLRDRLDDIPLLVDTLLHELRAPIDVVRRLTARAFLERLKHMPWPGNIRELRTYVERALVLPNDDLEMSITAPGDVNVEAFSSLPTTHVTSGEDFMRAVQADEPYASARERAIAAFERIYLEKLLQRHTIVAGAARVAGMNRVYLHRLLRRHGLRGEGGDT
jgi:two-component system, NtrC family, response regulator GlrR